MATPTTIEINLSEDFPHLPKAPIVEAVIEVVARGENVVDEASQLKTLETRLPDYPSKQNQRHVQHQIKLTPSNPAETTTQDFGWNGHVCRSTDNQQVAQFNRDAFRFSRLQPYESWEKFSTEALRLWEIHYELWRPSEMQRLGLRFINKINVPMEPLDLDWYLTVSPRSPENLLLPLTGFLHTDTMLIPGHPLGMQITQTILPPQPTEDKLVGLVLDIDVFTLHPLELKVELIKTYLAQMRWLKNKAFFGSLKPQALERFK